MSDALKKLTPLNYELKILKINVETVRTLSSYLSIESIGHYSPYEHSCHIDKASNRQIPSNRQTRLLKS